MSLEMKRWLQCREQCLIYDKEWFAESFDKKFEDMDIAVPREYDKVLTQGYGNYMEMKRNTAAHEYPFFKNQKAFLEELNSRIYIQSNGK